MHRMLLVSFLAATALGQTVPTAGLGVPVATLRFKVVDAEDNKSLPARITFRRDDEFEPLLFPATQADPLRLAIRRNCLFTLLGEGDITVPPGTYQIFASRGMEWSIDRQRITLKDGEASQIEFRLRHDVRTLGWISADFHLHTVTHSGHGDANLSERIITLVGEGVEFAVASDHNKIQDYRPEMDKLSVRHALTAVPGDEVSTPLGHFNSFPLAVGRKIADPRSRDATALFSFLRKEQNEFGVVPLIQVNHPRWEGIDYFRIGEVDPVAGTAAAPFWSDDFDAIEVLNENEGWGYEDAEITKDVFIGGSHHSVLRDFFNLLNRGSRCVATGNSDSHTVSFELAGVPRNFLASPTDDPGKIDPRDIAAAVRRGALFTTNGPFVTWTANGEGMGATIRGRHVLLRIRIEAPAWVSCDRVRVIVNGDEARVLAVPKSAGAVAQDLATTLELERDSWIALLVEGDTPMDIFPRQQQRPILPRAVTNPIRVDADGDGRWTAPSDQAAALAASLGVEDPIAQVEALGLLASERALLVLAAAEKKTSAAVALATAALRDSRRWLRLAGARGAQWLGKDELRPALVEALDRAGDDHYLRASVIAAIGSFDGAVAKDLAMGFLGTAGAKTFRRFDAELSRHLPGSFVKEWMVLGTFPETSKDALTAFEFGPEKDASTERTYAVKDRGEIKWAEVEAARTGLVDLGNILAIAKQPLENVVTFAQTWLHVDQAVDVPYTLGTDDGCRLQVNDKIVLTDRRSQSAEPWTHHGTLKLDAGWNRILLKIENLGGAHGLIFRVLDDRVKSSRRR